VVCFITTILQTSILSPAFLALLETSVYFAFDLPTCRRCPIVALQKHGTTTTTHLTCPSAREHRWSFLTRTSIPSPNAGLDFTLRTFSPTCSPADLKRTPTKSLDRCAHGANKYVTCRLQPGNDSTTSRECDAADCSACVKLDAQGKQTDATVRIHTPARVSWSVICFSQ
jgi:hypothetical protein